MLNQRKPLPELMPNLITSQSLGSEHVGFELLKPLSRKSAAFHNLSLGHTSLLVRLKISYFLLKETYFRFEPESSPLFSL